ncbi:hypothetical protein B0H13DRAFT_2301398 [Mycena leptocephala]|nr:hypothetical protein B0H13DRAFT_2301398 [Mycena leptocephala]
MTQETPFKISDWIGKGKLMSAAPPSVHRIAKDIFEIPQAFIYEITPSPMFPVTEMLKFSVPLEAIPNGTSGPAQYFSKSAKVIRNLVGASRQAWLDGYESVMYSHLGTGVVTHFPLWVLTSWNTILDFKRDVRAHWVQSSHWLAQHKKYSHENPVRAALVEEAEHILCMMPWGWAKPLGLSDSKLLHHLWHFVGPHWLAGSQRNDMLKLLHKVNNDSALAWRIRIQGIALTPKIIDTHKAGTETYQNSQSFGWLRDVGNDLVRNQAALITTAHLGNIINEPHWIGLVRDLSRPAGEILYGDSFDKPVQDCCG